MLPQISVVKILLHVSLPLRRPAFSSTFYFMHWFLFDSFYPLGYIRSFLHEYWTDLEQTSSSRTWQMVWACFLIMSCLEFMLLRGKACIQHVRHCHLAWLPSSCLTTHSEEAFLSFLHRSASNQIQGRFFSKTSLQSASLFPSRCSPEVAPHDSAGPAWWRKIDTTASISSPEQGNTCPSSNTVGITCHLAYELLLLLIVTWSLLSSLLSGAAWIQRSILLPITVLLLTWSKQEMLGLPLGCHRRVNKLCHTSLGGSVLLPLKF